MEEITVYRPRTTYAARGLKKKLKEKKKNTLQKPQRQNVSGLVLLEMRIFSWEP